VDVMSATPIKQKVKAFSLLELFFVLVTLALLAAMVLPRLAGSSRSPMIMCMNNLKQIGLGFNMFAEDHTNQFPMQTSVTNGGSMEFVGTGSPAPHFQAVSNYLGGYWRVLLCPTDKARQQTTNGAALSDRNISYFLSMDATCQTPEVILAGDRRLEVAGQPVTPGLFPLTTNAPVTWAHELHAQRGNLLFADGHVELARQSLPAALQRQKLATNRLAFP
jgi:prepilin-type processing-associated H-X9-DG protein